MATHANADGLIGRAAERLALSDTVARVAEGSVCVEIVGEPGIGKTTMMSWLGECAGNSNILVVGARGSEFEQNMPFAIFSDALGGLLSEFGDRWQRHLGRDVIDELGVIFPMLRSSEQAAHSPPASERFRVHRAVRSLLERLAVARPLMIALDDVHWADELSGELIGALLRRPPSARVLIALGYRPGQVPSRLQRTLVAASHEGMLSSVELGPLSLQESEELLADEVPVASERRRLYTESGGNPFYLRQLARGSTGDGAGYDIGSGVPAAVAASLTAELQRVPQGAREFAQAASVAGDPFDLDLAADIGRVDRDAALLMLDELIDAGVLRADRRPLGFAFRHPLVRRAVYESTRPGWRIAAHARADGAMVQRGAAPVERAHHVEQSARVGDPEATEVLLAAAGAALTPLASARWLRAALRLLPADGRPSLEVRSLLGRELSTAGQLAESRAVLTGVLRDWPVADARGRTALIVACAQVERLLGQFELARARLAAAAGELDDPASEPAVMLALELTMQHMFAARFADMREPADQALRGARAGGNPVLELFALVVVAFTCCCEGDLRSARAHVTEASVLIEQLGDAAPALQPAAFHGLGWEELLLDRYEASVAHFTRGIAITRASGHGQLYVELTSSRAEALTMWGRLADARTSADEAVESARLSDHRQPLAVALMCSCFVHRAAGDLDAAVADGRESVGLAPDDSLISATCAAHLGMALTEAGEWQEAVQVILAPAGGSELSSIFAVHRPMVCESLVHAEIELGHLSRAQAHARQALAVAQRLSSPMTRAFADRAAARVLLAEGDALGAAARAVASADVAAAVHAPVEAGRSRLLAGRALAAAGDRGRAAEQLRAGEIGLAACGAERLRQECVRELRRIGRRVAHAGSRGDSTARGPSALSGREREVAALIGDRMTNREIAARLVLSEKTIESHVRSLFVKLGVTSRREIARALDVAS